MKYVWINRYDYGWGGAHESEEDARKAASTAIKQLKEIAVKFERKE